MKLIFGSEPDAPVARIVQFAQRAVREYFDQTLADCQPPSGQEHEPIEEGAL